MWKQVNQFQQIQSQNHKSISEQVTKALETNNNPFLCKSQFETILQELCKIDLSDKILPQIFSIIIYQQLKLKTIE